jgi:hypothetical protein
MSRYPEDHDPDYVIDRRAAVRNIRSQVLVSAVIFATLLLAISVVGEMGESRDAFQSSNTAAGRTGSTGCLTRIQPNPVVRA